MSKLKIISNADYHGDKTHLSASGVKKLLENPYGFLNPVDKSTNNMLLGSVVHKLILEPDTFHEEFVVMPEFNRRTKDGKAAYDEFMECNQDKDCITKDMHDQAVAMSEAVLNQKEIKDLLFSNGVAERSVFGEIDGVKVKCRPDYYREDMGLIVDLKTTADASPDAFVRSIANFGYFIQDPFYRDTMKSVGLPVNKFVFVAVSSVEPYMVGVYELTPQDIDFGRDMYQKAFEIYKDLDSYKRPIFLGKEKEVVQTLVLPNYIYYKGQ